MDATRLLIRAIGLSNQEMMLRAIYEGADINSSNRMGHTVLHYAASRGREIAELLIEKGAQLDRKDSWGRTPLHLAVCECNPETVGLFVEMGADVNAKDLEGQTPLHFAAIHGCHVSAEILLKAGAGLDARNKSGHLPIALASGAVLALLQKETELAEMREKARAFAHPPGFARNPVPPLRLLPCRMQPG